ncbi:MAG: YhcH/YjgK/YiaL family protein [Paludibacterium sp.]|uniref:YhcH/YjgK/YiaL family protein n=1 Tax=Paludibacterium sp. TaxID=1917523 RepID=UPI0025F3C897|nr:YhcH/YjgK/YiaL family protein [Paludibacterium sp.]MBV8048065.1 YhcH/YjgK/YiaL family protein [Paludibacterium sp.]MBV8646948.1 YhcH/YjgK/YiaL family protein [Paludibacterium sp.]
MYCDHIDNLSSCPLTPALRDCIGLLPQFAAQPPGRYPIDGERCFALVQEMTTVPASERRLEAHGRYLDVQYLVSGEENIGYLPSGSSATVREDRLADKDIAFYDAPQPPCELALSAGMYAIFQPGEFHRPGCAVTNPMPIKKVVLKWLPEANV